jgi:hypothetical protein
MRTTARIWSVNWLNISRLHVSNKCTENWGTHFPTLTLSQHVLRFQRQLNNVNENATITMLSPDLMWWHDVGYLEAILETLFSFFTFCSPCITTQLLQFEPTDAHNFIKVTILQHTSYYMFPDDGPVRPETCRSWGVVILWLLYNYVHSLVWIVIINFYF